MSNIKVMKSISTIVYDKNPKILIKEVVWKAERKCQFFWVIINHHSVKPLCWILESAIPQWGFGVSHCNVVDFDLQFSITTPRK
jgi:hypothetical protein